MSKAYLFTREDVSITTVSFEDTPEHIRKLLACERFTTVRVDDNHTAYVSDDEPPAGRQPCTKFVFYDVPIIGSALIVGSDPMSECSLDATISTDTAVSLVESVGEFDWHEFMASGAGMQGEGIPVRH